MTATYRYCSHPSCRKVHAFPREQATYVEPARSWRGDVRRHWPEIVGGVAVVLGTWIGLPWVLALAAGGGK